MNGDEKPDTCLMKNFIAVPSLGMFYDPTTGFYCAMNADGTPDSYEGAICHIDDNEYADEKEKESYLRKINTAMSDFRCDLQLISL